ncbi:hypothetical protein JZU69_03630, partial [bacterium]|nr:hypothetical protein [bacterium]
MKKSSNIQLTRLSAGFLLHFFFRTGRDQPGNELTQCVWRTEESVYRRLQVQPECFLSANHPEFLRKLRSV